MGLYCFPDASSLPSCPPLPSPPLWGGSPPPPGGGFFFFYSCNTVKTPLFFLSPPAGNREAMMMRSFLALSLVTTATAIGSSAIYAVSSSRTLTYTLNKVNGAWAEAHMKVVIMTATAATDSRMESAEETAEGLMPCTCPETDPGATLTPANDISGCYELHIGSRTRHLQHSNWVQHRHHHLCRARCTH